MKYDNFTIIVQGPLHHNGIYALQYYTKFCNVILSCYEENVITENQKKIISIYDNVELIQGKLPTIPRYNGCSTFVHTFSTLNGLRLVDTEYVIKIRFDEIYSDIEPMIKAIIANPKKLVTNNIAFNRCTECLFHPSGHMIGGKTKNIVKMLKFVRELCLNNPMSDQNFPYKLLDIGINDGGCTNEVIWSVAYLKSIGVDFSDFISTDNERRVLLASEIMREHTFCVPVEELGKDVIWTCHHNGTRIHRRGNDGLYGYWCDSIRRIEEC